MLSQVVQRRFFQLFFLVSSKIGERLRTNMLNKKAVVTAIDGIVLAQHDRLSSSQEKSLEVKISMIHPQSLTWNLKMMVSKRNLLFQGLKTSSSMLNFRDDTCWVFQNVADKFGRKPAGCVFCEPQTVRLAVLMNRI